MSHLKPNDDESTEFVRIFGRRGSRRSGGLAGRSRFGVNTRKKIARTIRQEKEKALERVGECLEETAHQVSRKAAKSAKE